MANANFNCNLSTGGRRGFNVSGSNQASSFKGNEVGGNYGLLVEENAILGLSANLVHQGNCWPGSSIKEALNKNQAPILVNHSQFTVDQEENNCFLPDWEAQGDWFIASNNQSASYSCGSLCPNGGAGAGFGSEVCDYADELLPLVSGDIAYTAYHNEHRWIDRFQVYTLLYEANCQDLSNSAQLFMDQVGNSEIGKLVLVESGLNSLAIEANDPNQLLLDSLHILQDILVDQLNAMSVMNWFRWDSIIVVDLTDQINSIQLLLDSLMEINTEVRNALLEDLIDFNSNISVSTTIATQLKFVNDLQIRSMMDPDFEMTETEKSELCNIAILCPDEGGYATLKARGLLHQMGYDQVFDDRLCHDNTIQPIKLKLPVEKIFVMPNPVFENVCISTLSGQAMMDIVLFDPIGREVLRHSKLENNYIYLNLAGMPSGNYVMQATLDNGDFVRTKINIIR